MSRILPIDDKYFSYVWVYMYRTLSTYMHCLNLRDETNNNRSQQMHYVRNLVGNNDTIFYLENS
jgi:hypothetical protein